MRRTHLLLLCLVALGVRAAEPCFEHLDRGLVAVRTSSGVFLSWRLLDTDSEDVSFQVLRDGTPVRSSGYTVTNAIDSKGTASSTYVVQVLEDGEAVEEYGPVGVWTNSFLTLKLDRPAGGVTPAYTVTNDKNTESYSSGQSYTYVPNDCSTGDVDGDGELEIILKWDPSNSRDNSQRGYTGNVIFDCYKLDGTRLWRIDLGRNIRAGAHYTQFLVFDFDGDGRAEMACKTAPGTLDGQGKAVLMGSHKFDADYRLTGSNAGIVKNTVAEYLTVFDGQTGAELATTAYKPALSAHTWDKSGWGDAYGNRCERYLACVAYLDGQHPSMVFCRGYYTYSHLWAVDFDGEKLSQRWLYASSTSSTASAYGQGAHGISVGDVDGDGCDEIIYGSAAIDHNGKFLYSTGLGHGDAIHLSDLDPDNPGLEVFMPHEDKAAKYGYEMHAAATGKILWGFNTGTDVGRGIAADYTDAYRGAECSAANGTQDCHGKTVNSNKMSQNFRIFWDDDVQEELLDGNAINKGPGGNKSWSLKGNSCNGTKKTPCLTADLFGDWREEVVLHNGADELYIHTTTAQCKFSVITPMQDHIYRMGVAWQNTAYNQPPHLGYFLPDALAAGIDWDSASAPTAQTIELGDSIQPIVFHYTKCTNIYCTGASTYGLEATVDTEARTLTLHGTPTRVGACKYTVKTTGGIVNTTFTDQIVVNAYTAVTPVPDDVSPVVYSLDGRRVLTPESGKIYIVGGRKRKF